MSIEELNRQMGGSFGKGLMKGMVQRNAIESAACEKVTRYLESQKQAFVKQNSRDEEDMRNLLNRLQLEQQATLADNNAISETNDENDDAIFDTFQTEWKCDEELINPYPVTIVPRFDDTFQKDSAKTSRRPGSTKSRYRRKSVEYEDIDDSLSFSGLTSSGFCADRSYISPTHLTAKEEVGDWLATPDAISSVRRMRKSVFEQLQSRICRKLSGEHQDTLSSSPSNSKQHSRQNSLKDKKRHCSHSEDSPSPRSDKVQRRGGSFKERNSRKDSKTEIKLIRSYTVLTKSKASEYRQKKDLSKLSLDENVPQTLSLGISTAQSIK